MNSTELYIAAGEAIAEWQKQETNRCTLYIKDGKVCCRRSAHETWREIDPLNITKFEIETGMDQSRWNSIGSALHELYCKEITCQTHQKH